MTLSRHDAESSPDVLDGFREGYMWEQLVRTDAYLANQIRDAGECLLLRGELEDRADLDYLRDAVGLIAFLLDHGGVTVYDPQMFHWWSPGEWRGKVFGPGEAVPHRHVVVLTTDDGAGHPPTWYHTRGLRKFGRPDLSMHGVLDRDRAAVVDLFDRFIEFQAFGGVIADGEDVRMKSLPPGLTCRHAGDLDDPEFNNVHVEIGPARSVGRRRRPS